MANANVSRLGLVNNTGTAVDALFLKKFAGEVLSAFEEKNIMKGLHTIRTIQNGKSAQFPVTGKATANYHVVGDDILDGSNNGGSGYLNNIKHAERVINIDELLISPVFISNLDEAKNHYDVRSIYSTEIGNALANTFDKNVLKTVIAASRAAAIIDHPAGGSVEVSSATTMAALTANEIVDALFEAAQKLDENDVPEERYCVLNPAGYYRLIADSANNRLSQLSRDFNDGSNGSIAKGNIVEVAGIRILKSNHLPVEQAAASAVTGQNNDPFEEAGSEANRSGYESGAGFANTFGVVFNPAAVGTVKLMDLSLESEYQIQRQGHLMVAKYAMGHGVLRGSNAVELLLK